MLDVNMKESLSTKEIKRQEVGCPPNSGTGEGSRGCFLCGERSKEHPRVTVSSCAPSFLSR